MCTYIRKKFNEYFLRLSVYLLLFFVVLIYGLNTPHDYFKSLYERNHRYLLTSSDVIPNTFFPYVFYKWKSFDFSPISFYLRQFDGGNKNPYFLVKVGEYKYSSYPILTGVIAFPIYLPFLILNKITLLIYPENISKILLVGRLSAIILTSFSVAVFYKTLIKLNAKTAESLLFSLVFAFGTSLWSISSRGLWTHTSVVLIFTLYLYLLIVRKDSKLKFFVLGLLAGLAVLARQTSFIFALIITAYIFNNKRKYTLSHISGSSIPIILMFIYNKLIFGGFLTDGYALRQDIKWTNPILSGLVSQFITPGKGIIFTSPFLLFFFLLNIKALFKLKNNLNNYFTLQKYLFFCVLAYILMYSKWYAWHGGNSFGHRFLTDVIPFMVMGIFYFFKHFYIPNKLKILFVLLCIYSIYVQWNAVYFNKSRCEDEDMNSFECIKPKILYKIRDEYKQ